VETNLDDHGEPKLELKKKKISEAQPQPMPLNNIFDPLRTTQPLCFNILAFENVLVELKT